MLQVISGLFPARLIITFWVPGRLSVGICKSWVYFAPFDFTLDRVKCFARTPSNSEPIIVDVNANGTTIFTTQGNRPRIPAGQNIGPVTTPDITAISEGDILSLDVDQIGIVESGRNLTVEVDAIQT